jgi:hypothetical protein
LVTGVGALTLTGVLGRVQRNSGAAFAAAVGFVIFGAAVWLIGSMISKRARTTKWRGRNIGPRAAVQILGVVLTLVGLFIGFLAAISTADDTEQPDVTLTLDAHARFATGAAKVSNLSSEDRLSVFVDGLADKKGGGFESSNLYQAFVGPDGDGDAHNDIKVRVPPGRFDAVGIRAFTSPHPADCGKYPRKETSEEGTGCAILRLPPRPTRPEVSASWEGSGTSLDVTLRAADVETLPKDQLVFLAVVGKGNRSRDSLYRTTIVLPSGGAVRRKVSLPIESRYCTVCIEASFITRTERLRKVACPIRHRAGSAAVQLRVPHRQGE